MNESGYKSPKDRAKYEDAFDRAQRTKKKGKNFIIVGIAFSLFLIIGASLTNVYLVNMLFYALIMIPLGIWFYYSGNKKANEAQEMLDDVSEMVRTEATEQFAEFNSNIHYVESKGRPDKNTIFILRKDAEQGDADAQLNLGLYYANGEGVPQDYKKAVYWWTKAAEQSVAVAQYELGVCYFEGEGALQDKKKAIYWWKHSASQGNAEAQFRVGLSYAEGDGVPKNNEKAVLWWTKAAEQGDADAQYELGVAYYQGRGVTQDFASALFWWERAANQGHPDAKRELQFIDNE